MSRDIAKYKKVILEKLNSTPIIEVACKKAGLPRSTLYRWMKTDEEFAIACDEAIEQSSGRINDMAESQLINAIKESNMTAIIFWLKNHHKTYETRVKVDARISQVDELTPEQSALVEQALKNAGLLLAESEKDNEL